MNHPTDKPSLNIIVRFWDAAANQWRRGNLLSPARIEGTDLLVEGTDTVAIACQGQTSGNIFMFDVPVAHVHNLTPAQVEG